MPEYLSPGVYVEEVSYRSKSIEGVSTSTAAFVGPTRYGPTRGEPEIITSFADFQRIYGGAEQLAYDGKAMHNFIAQGVRTFFAEGGGRCYVVRTFKEGADDGHATAQIAAGETQLNLRARYPGEAGNMRLTFNVRLGLNILSQDPADPSNPAGDKVNILRGIGEHDVVWVKNAADNTGEFYWVESILEDQRPTFRLRLDDAAGDGAGALKLSELDPSGATVHQVTVNVSIGFPGTKGKILREELYGGFAPHPAHPNALSNFFTAEPSSRATELYIPLVVEQPSETNGAAIVKAMLQQKGVVGQVLTDLLTAKGLAVGDAGLTFQVKMTGGNDGARPGAAEYEGDEGVGAGGRKTGLCTLKDVDDISIVLAPGSTYDYTNFKQDADQITRLLIAHCELMRFRVAILDSADKALTSEVRAYRAQLDSKYAALYYPWLRTLDPITNQMINLPPSAFVAGIYARNDAQYGVHKAPANEVVRTAQGMAVPVNRGQQDVLNPDGVNCFRVFEGRGVTLWGARTISSDPEWKYINLRRYFAYLEHSLDKGTQWAVFMPNGEALWDNVRATISDFLFSEWHSGRLAGASPAEAYFVQCDRTTMTQNDIDNGRMICQIGVSPLRPAEFVIFRIGQWTANS